MNLRNKKPTQCERILEALRRNPRGITGIEIVQMGILQYNARIHDLKEKGYCIDSERTGNGYNRFTLVHSPWRVR